MTAITGTLSVTEADDTLASSGERTPAASLSPPGGRARLIAFEPRLDLGIRARAPYLYRGRLTQRPRVLTQRFAADVDPTKARLKIDSSAYSDQTANGNYPTVDLGLDIGPIGGIF